MACAKVPALNIANALTVLRVVLVPVFILFFLADEGEGGGWRWAAVLVFAVAIYTDKLDGDLARSRGLITDFGKIADPIADKLLIGSALIALSLLGEVPWWMTVVILVREVGITAMRFVVIRKQVIPASRGGKIKTVIQTAAIMLALLPLTTLWPAWSVLVFFVMLAATVITVITGFDYFLQFFRARPTGREGR
ncbi:CDP-diacylglycerol--glycerol-3-phosphate 3-phosphatidyltransferase [Acaricomes phytoseiuli]|uniref:CDP-diacylglycerol--glycerol-3-phosphate 3-phosphatidyltransferase n=1 Tax=Acaricomes phytoseiuli TaxID=291968 RepID=UPI0004779115|nr:CDP-diacylglycerol--glycerol-3-phosphate 3-phosphatidyltransferase [Acaricomes phytoseiuli]MCW1248807.1 CDP-diacylglycerol--glycerol-3-phosphate 3-phosphatidyltransferase [Acaricomes phytoseiuli]